jgi:hypothetical protein
MPINDNLMLLPVVLDNLYGGTLYSIEEQPGKPAQKERRAITKKLMTVITGVPIKPGNDALSQNFLSGIIQACRIPATEVYMFCAQTDEINFKYLQDSCPSPIVLMFDVTPGDIGLPVYFPHFQLQLFSGITYLSAPDLATLQDDKLLKSKLWLCLKQHFAI